MILAEIALLVSLPSADGEVSHSAAKGLRLLAHIESQIDAPNNPTITEEDKSKRYPVYDRLGDPKVLVVGESLKLCSMSLFIHDLIQAVSLIKRG